MPRRSHRGSRRGQLFLCRSAGLVCTANTSRSTRSQRQCTGWGASPKLHIIQPAHADVLLSHSSHREGGMVVAQTDGWGGGVLLSGWARAACANTRDTRAILRSRLPAYSPLLLLTCSMTLSKKSSGSSKKHAGSGACSHLRRLPFDSVDGVAGSALSVGCARTLAAIVSTTLTR